MLYLKVDPQQYDEAAISQAAEIILRGGIVAFPTDTIYALGVDPYNQQALMKLYELKQRPLGKPLPLLIGRREQVGELVTEAPEAAQKLMGRFWPGPLTLVFHSGEGLLHSQVTAEGKIGLRLPASKIARRLCQLSGLPITASSANLAGQPGSLSASQVYKYFAEKLDAILDAGPAPGSQVSTVLDVTERPPRILRAGAIKLPL